MVSWFLGSFGLNVSKFLGFPVSKFLGSNDAPHSFKRFRVSKIQVHLILAKSNVCSWIILIQFPRDPTDLKTDPHHVQGHAFSKLVKKHIYFRNKRVINQILKIMIWELSSIPFKSDSDDGF